MYDASVHVPLIIWSPTRFKGGTIVDSLQQLFDVGPTILELAEIEPPSNFEAVSLLPALTGNVDTNPRKYVYSEHARDAVQDAAEIELMIRSKRWKLVEFCDPASGQLFDLINDPNEIHDLWNNPTHSSIQQELLHELHTWFITSTTKTAGWDNEPRYG